MCVWIRGKDSPQAFLTRFSCSICSATHTHLSDWVHTLAFLQKAHSEQPSVGLLLCGWPSSMSAWTWSRSCCSCTATAGIQMNRAFLTCAKFDTECLGRVQKLYEQVCCLDWRTTFLRYSIACGVECLSHHIWSVIFSPWPRGSTDSLWVLDPVIQGFLNLLSSIFYFPLLSLSFLLLTLSCHTVLILRQWCVRAAAI